MGAAVTTGCCLSWLATVHLPPVAPDSNVFWLFFFLALWSGGGDEKSSGLLFLVSPLMAVGSNQGSLAEEIHKAELRMTQIFKLELNSRKEKSLTAFALLSLTLWWQAPSFCKKQLHPPAASHSKTASYPPVLHTPGLHTCNLVIRLLDLIIPSNTWLASRAAVVHMLLFTCYEGIVWLCPLSWGCTALSQVANTGEAKRSHALRSTRGYLTRDLKKKIRLTSIAKQLKQLVANLMTHCFTTGDAHRLRTCNIAEQKWNQSVTMFCKQIRDLSRFHKS